MIRFEFWGSSTQLKTMELKKGEKLRLKTRGNSIIVDSCASMKPTAQNYSGEVCNDMFVSNINFRM